ncbi:hypothetical protein [Natrinema salsiterrestre]|uniref:Uncharacterized protein n=1 Tax=Natrinema salsiterrestre TaxID=2950540 RepID=A0A9Q4L6K3_9EURY|nr:hypothetical protein [Natrinema salsiterrestre]MDF9747492.1 hypothetical protein [Natrinema salsiterrestre]
MSKLQLKGFLNVREENKGRRGGKQHKYEIAVDSEIVSDALKDIRRLESLTQKTTLNQFS